MQKWKTCQSNPFSAATTFVTFILHVLLGLPHCRTAIFYYVYSIYVFYCITDVLVCNYNL